MTTTNIVLEHHLIETNGVTLHVVQAGPQEGELVILLHGFPDFWYGWHRQIEALAERGFRVWAPDQRGYNLSEKPSGLGAYQIDVLAKDVIGLIDASGREKVVLVGHDWGAAVTWHTSLWYPDRVKKIAILNVPHPSVMTKALRTNPAQMLKSWYIGFFQIPAIPEFLMGIGTMTPMAQALLNSSRKGTFTDNDITQYLKAWQQPGALTAMLNWYRAVAQMPVNLPKDRQVKVPVLIIWGAKDAFLGVEMAQQSIDRCADGRLVVFDNATHWVQHEEAEQVNLLLAEWAAG